MLTMTTRLARTIALATTLGMLAMPSLVSAKATPEEAAKLGLEGTELTPAGAIRAGNADGTIPEWKNEPLAPPANFKPGTFHVDPFPDDKILFTITAQNFKQYADKLSVGHQKMFQTYPDYKMNVYQTRRTAVYKPYIYEAALRNAPRAEVEMSTNTPNLVGFKGAEQAWAFPIPHNGNEAFLNQATRPSQPWMENWENTTPVTSTGNYETVKLRIQQHWSWADPQSTLANGYDPTEGGLYYYQTITAPAKQAGQVVLAKDPVSFSKRFRHAWSYSPGQRRVKRAPQIVYDNPFTSADGLATTDQKWGFNGPNDRFEYTLIGRKEIYVPYNAYKLWAQDVGPKQMITDKGRLNQDLARYELHRVWVVDSKLREGTNHDYGRRTYYLDEDSWWIMAVDCYDRRDQLWRLWEEHDVFWYDVGFVGTAVGLQYDMQAGRMLLTNPGKDSPPDFNYRANMDYFTPGSIRRSGVR